MKKIIGLMLAVFVFTCSAFCGEKWMENTHIEIDARLGISTNALEIQGVYMLPINKNFYWDAGLEIDLVNNSLLSSLMGGVLVSSGGDAAFNYSGLNIKTIASIWFKEIYLRYGFGIGFPQEGIGVLPYDVRLGWQPNYHKTEKRWLFKIETGLTSALLYQEQKLEDGNIEKSVMCMPDAILTLGATYKF